MIILDASVLIGHFEPKHQHHEKAGALLQAHRSRRFGASVITLAEFFAGASRAGLTGHTEQLLGQLGVESVPLLADAGRRLGELRSITRLKMPDCCVLYAAEHCDAAVATFDTKLAEQARQLGRAVTT